MPSSHNSGASNELRQAIDRLAVLAVTESWSGLAEASDAVAAKTKAVGGELDRIASALAKSVRQIPGGEAAPAALGAEVERQIAALQALAARGATPDAGLFHGPLAHDPELVSDFLIESREHLGSIEAQALNLESDPSHPEAIHAIFRAFHTIKGLAGFLEFAAVQEVAHEIETLLDLARQGDISITPAIIDVVLESADYLNSWLKHIEMALAGQATDAPAGLDVLLERIRHFAQPSAVCEPEEHRAALAILSDSVSGHTSEPEPAPAASAGESAARRPASELRVIKVDTAKLDYLVEMVGEMVIAQSLIRHDPDLAKLKTARLTRNIAQASRITGEVQKVAMAMRMVPIGHLFQRMTRLVRDVARKEGKSAELEISGEETELDRTIVEELADPLMHMVRNAVDHGIEAPADRAAAQKPETARISLRALHQGGNILIEVADDGRGLDRQKILKKARERGLLQQLPAFGRDQLPDNEVFQLIFEPGFSTADRITDISGRGVGMDVVKKQVQKMRGRIDIQSTPGQGTIFSIKLPLTLAIIDGLVVGGGEERYIVPIFSVQETLRPSEESLSTLPNGTEMALIRGSLVPVLRLAHLFRVPAYSENIWEALLVICESGGKRFALMVDDLIGKQEVVIKSLGKTFRNARGIAGGAILGDGRVGLILNIEGLIGARGDASHA